MDGIAAEARGFGVVDTETSGDDLQLGVQKLLAACEKRREAGADVRIQFHVSAEVHREVDDGACNHELVEYGWRCNRDGHM